ncbi:MAG: hypothetical protein ACT4O1_15540 [Gemmatimonadota bacterium]
MTALPRPEPTHALHDKAAADLHYIRSAMERADSFTAVSGIGYIAIGTSALIAAAVAARSASFEAWLTVWFVELAVAIAIAIAATTQKARRLELPLARGAGRKLLLGFTPVMAAGAVLTVALINANAQALLPGMWLAVYGAAVVAGGVYSIRPVPILGAALLLLGSAALLLPSLPAGLVLALGFGGFHIACGIVIARRHGG